MTMLEVMQDRVRGARRRMPRPSVPSLSWSQRPQWWWKAVLAAVPFVTVAVAYVWLQSPLTRADRVVVSGLNHLQFGDVVVAADVLDRQLININASDTEQRLEALPFVRDATVVRNWPDRVTIAIVEREPVASIPNDDGTFSVVDAEGRVVAISDGIFSSQPVLVTISNAPPPGEYIDDSDAPALLEAAALVPVELWGRIASLELDDDGELIAKLGDWQTAVRLGDPSDLGRKYRSLASVLVSTDLEGVSAIDVRVPDAPVLIRGVLTD